MVGHILNLKKALTFGFDDLPLDFMWYIQDQEVAESLAGELSG